MDGDFDVMALSPTQQALLDDALRGLTQPVKTLSPKWLYDQCGSELFEQITRLPEYYLTRTETEILRRNAGRLAGLVRRGGALVELGSGASVKTRLLLDAGGHMGAYVPIDISRDFLLKTAASLREMFPGLEIAPVVADFLSPVAFPAELAASGKTGFFPGSTIGNLSPKMARALLSRARTWPGASRFILGADLVKEPGALVAAYDDAAGVTARFIMNGLARLNRELGANFNLDAFCYLAQWDAANARVDMSLVSRRRQAVDLMGHSISFDADEPIHVSASRKFTADSLSALVASAGWELEELLTDDLQRFAVAVLKA